MRIHRAFRQVAMPLSALTLGAGAILLPASSASAGEGPQATVDATGPTLIFTAADGQANQLTVRTVRGEVVDERYYYTYILEDVHEISAGVNCEHPEASVLTRVECRLEVFDSRDPYVTGRFLLGDKNDTVRYHNDAKQSYYWNEFWLGSGNDKANTRQPGKVTDGSGVWGQNGNDDLTTGSIGDNGGAFGGNGRDTIHSYGSTRMSGGNGDDKLYGDDSYQSIRGDAGNDLIDAGGGGESLWGGAGNDTIYGRAGADTIYGNSGNDRLYGGPGTDTISGGPGKDYIKHD